MPASISTVATLPRLIVRGLAIALAGIFAAGVFLVWPHVAGAVFGLPKLDRLFVELHGDAILLEALKEQNAALVEKDESWALVQDRIWVSERLKGAGPLQRAYLDRPASRHLLDVVSASDGLIGHAFLIDAKGRMAALALPSFNFWQFDKPKFHYVFPRGAGARDVSWLQLSSDGSHPVCWRAETMIAPASGEPIGVLALEVNYLKVGYFGCREEPLHTPRERATNHVTP